MAGGAAKRGPRATKLDARRFAGRQSGEIGIRRKGAVGARKERVYIKRLSGAGGGQRGRYFLAYTSVPSSERGGRTLRGYKFFTVGRLTILGKYIVGGVVTRSDMVGNRAVEN